jgi:hypothetical protein
MSCPDSIPVNDQPDEGQDCAASGQAHDPNQNEPMSRDDAYSIAIDFGMVFGVRLLPKRIGRGFSALVPMEILKRYLPEPREPVHRTRRRG